VIAIEGYRRASGSLSCTFRAGIYAKITEPVEAHYFLQILFGLNRSVFEIKRFKRYFFERLARALWEMRIWIRKKAIGAQIEPRIPHVLGIGISLYSRVVWHSFTPLWWQILQLDQNWIGENIPVRNRIPGRIKPPVFPCIGDIGRSNLPDALQ